MKPNELQARLESTAFAFRGYNITNLGRSPELLAHQAYGPIVRECLESASSVCAKVTGKPADLVSRVERREEPSLDAYSEAIALVMAMEQAQIRILGEQFGIELKHAQFTMGYSLGEITAVAMSGVLELSDAMRVPLALAEDCAELAHEVTLGVAFSRGKLLPMDAIRKLCLEINQAAQGVIGISAILSPNSILLMGQGDTLDRFRIAMRRFPDRMTLRKNDHKFPPLHTPIVWQRNICDRAAVLMQTLRGGLTAPSPKVLSLVTGKCSYTDVNARQILQDWTDHPQLLWEVVYEVLRSDVDTVVHVGPEPNIMPATFTRLKDNVETETKGKIGMRALTAVVDHPWIKRLLPERTALLRAPLITQLILEDWLLAQ
ncbi:MAG: ACP S-malonyltransferase [Planctomycetota bacterium]|nr:ACP S-malonyltransferase [Planctomycetota bacterium]